MGKDSKNFKTSEGYKCLKAAAEAKPDIPIIVVDRGAVEDKAPFLSLGVTDFVRGTLYKPQSDPMDESNPEGLALDREDLTAIFARQHFVKMAGELARERKRLACDAVYEYAEKEPGELEIRFTDLRVESAEEEDAESRRQNRKYLLAERPRVRVKDIFGNALVKEAAERCIDNIRNPEKYRNAEAKLMTGILMYGAPGMGKTMFAKAMAFEANASFISAVGADFLSGDGVLKMEEMFRTARRRSPCIFFIDEFDAISKDRGSYGMTSYQETVLDKFLKEMDGLETDNNGVYVVAATNYSLEDLDPAVTRRFSARIHVPYPTLEERQRFLLDLLEKKGLKDRISERAARTLSLMMSGKIRNYAEIKTFLEESIADAVYKTGSAESVTEKFLFDRVHAETDGAVWQEKNLEFRAISLCCERCGKSSDFRESSESLCRCAGKRRKVPPFCKRRGCAGVSGNAGAESLPSGRSTFLQSL